jgi:hypothetical protein
MTFRPPGATPVSIAVDPGTQPAKATQTDAPAEKNGGGSKVVFVVLGVVALAAVGVATGWFLTQ